MKTETSLYRLYEDVSEKAFQQQVIEAARLCGWLCYHTWSSLHSPAGYPDLTLCKADGTGLLLLEVKTERGRISAAQQQWIAALQANGIEARVVRPHQIDEVLERLKR